MKKVAIVSCYFKKNYGSQLQAYATQKILDDWNIKNYTINISENYDFKNGKKKYYLTQITNLNFLRTKLGMIKLKIDKILNKKLKQNINIRDKKFEEFKNKFNITKPYKNYKELTELVKKEYSDVIVGSDQLWLPVNVVSNYYTLNWVPKEINKISFATSFGFSNIPDKYENLYKNFLNKIECLSTREKQGVEIIKNVTGRDAKLVCDPTLLFNKDEWMEIQEENRIVKDKYIFCYFLGKSIEHRKFVERLKEKTGYKIVSINHCDEYVKYSDKFADEIPYDVGPGEFLNLIRNSEFVCTDSFHGTVFALINNVDFFVFRRFQKNEKASTNSRIHSLLEITKLEERLMNGNENIKDVLTLKINYDDVNEKIEKFRNDSKMFLKKSLNID